MNLNKILFSAISFLSLLYFSGCTPRQVVKTDTVQNSVSSPVNTSIGDTIRYAIDFNNQSERERFLSNFRIFLDDYPFAKILSTDHSTVVINTLPVKNTGNGFIQGQQIPVRGPDFTGNMIQQNADPSVLKDTIYTITDNLTNDFEPSSGGSIKVFTQRSILEEPFLSLVSAYPFERKSEPGYLTVVDQMPKKITLRLNGKLTNGKGKVLSALDIIDSWTYCVKSFPAEGLALFRQVEGMREFIDGREAVIRGFLATDQNTIQLKLTQDDPYIIDRISTSRLLSSKVKSGSYYLDAVGGADESVLLSNKSSGRKTGYLDRMIIKHGGDVNPVLSYSLKKYDAILLTAKNDIEYARQNLSKNGMCEILARERYFITINCKEPAARQYLSSLVNAQEILKNFVKADGECISEIEEYKPLITPVITAAKHPGMIQPVKVIFRKDDPVSKIIAEKLIADFTKGNIPCLLAGVNVQEYEKMLVSRNYGCAVGWVNSVITDDKSEKLRLATIWFGDNINERSRIDNFQEVPLFEINKYILYRNGLVIPQNNLQNIYVQNASN